MKILITGTAKGIGKATAEYFLDKGHEVAGLDVLGSSIDHMNYTHHIADVSDENTFPELDGIEVIINNAGVQNCNDIEINLKGTIKISEFYISRNTRAVVNVASTSAHTGAEFGEYAASKGGILAYTKNLASRLAPQGATANSISPGGVKTEMNLPVMEDEKLWNQIMDLTPMKKWAEPEEIARWIYFLAVENKSATGIDIIVDNGENTCGAKFIWPE
ncbi:SDR family oxidoreductase [Treponema sp.]|uniref:SDR family NAD(P)-dependent oxidoreductase n=1 Tax=Treponema sp. TaxID=166 RepID=UPI00298E2784|nr:SDR family oxidoreductase [Treponema sp.]MCQ2242315.1 SDR family oxidoreductase [Treponema sp.]